MCGKTNVFPSRSSGCELAVGLARAVAHLLVAERDPGLAHARLQLRDHGQERLPAGSARVLDRLDRLRGEPRHVGDEPGEQPLLVQRLVARRADRSHVERRGIDADLAAGLADGAREDLRHAERAELAEHGLVVGGDVDGLHGTGS
jgi:hypothetical protein